MEATAQIQPGPHAVRARRGAAPTDRRARVGRDPGPAPLVLTGDLELLDEVLAAAAAAGVEPTVMADAAAIRSHWSTAPMVLIGTDQARQTAELLLPRRTEVYLVGPEAGQQELWRWSTPLGAAVVALPGGSGLLTAAIADVTGRPSGSGRVVAVIGGSGGVGASSTAAALAVTASGGGDSTLLIDLDGFGGGIDLLVGAEAIAGWRWPRLGGAQGHLGDLTGHLPRIGELDVLSMARDGDPAAGLEPEPVRAVIRSATRSHRLAVLDLPRGHDPGTLEALRGADLTLLLVRGDVRGVAAGQRALATLREATTDLRLLVRRPRTGAVDGPTVADALEVPLAGTVGEDPTLARAAERGEPPGRAPRSPLARLGRRLVADLALAEAVTPG